MILKIDQKQSPSPAVFSWRGDVPAPFAKSGVLRFKLALPQMFVAKFMPSDYQFNNTVLRFVSTFSVLSASCDMTPYHRAIAPALKEQGLASPEEALLLAWALIHKGLQNYANALGPYLAPSQEADVPLPISPMHIWAMGEAARAFIGCLPDNGSMEVYQQIANVITVATYDESAFMNETYSPYTNVFIDQA